MSCRMQRRKAKQERLRLAEEQKRAREGSDLEGHPNEAGGILHPGQPAQQHVWHDLFACMVTIL